MHCIKKEKDLPARSVKLGLILNKNYILSFLFYKNFVWQEKLFFSWWTKPCYKSYKIIFCNLYLEYEIVCSSRLFGNSDRLRMRFLTESIIFFVTQNVCKAKEERQSIAHCLFFLTKYEIILQFKKLWQSFPLSKSHIFMFSLSITWLE